MFEITYNDADALERYEEEKRAYPGAKYDFTFEKRFLVYHADMLHQIIYYAIDMKTGLSSEVMRRKSGSPIKKAEYASVLMDRLMDSIKYVGDRRTYLSESIAPLHMIDNIFRVILPHYGFSRDYFQSLISYVTIGSDGTVGVRTKTDTTVKEDKQDG